MMICSRQTCRMSSLLSGWAKFRSLLSVCLSLADHVALPLPSSSFTSTLPLALSPLPHSTLPSFPTSSLSLSISLPSFHLTFLHFVRLV